MHRVTDTIRVQQSQVWQTNTGIIDTGDGVLLLDPGVLASELLTLVDALGDTPIRAGFATHFHWDHILWPPAQDAPRFASEETRDLVTRHRERLDGMLDQVEQQMATAYQVDQQWDRARFYDLQPMPLGPGTIASIAVELVDVSGHCDGQVALVLPDHDVAFVADTLSDVEVPSLAEGEGQRERYLQTLDRLQGIIDRVSWTIPGHGSVADRAEAQRRLDLDRRYLEHLPNAIASASADEPDEDLAARILTDLDESRASGDLSAQMHLDNVKMLRAT